MSYDAGWDGKWVNGWGRWFNYPIPKPPAEHVSPQTMTHETAEKPLLWVVESGKPVPFVRDRRVGFKP